MTTALDLPALLGGSPVRPEGPPTWPLSDPTIAAALHEVYTDGSWGRYHGIYVPRLEKRLQEFLGSPHVLLCGSGTYAVELALRGLRIGAEDEVILGAYDFPGNFLSVHAVGARPVLVDMGRAGGTLDHAQLESALSKRTRAILMSHLHGGVVPMRAVMALARRLDVPVIEDAAQMPGAWIEGQRAGIGGDVGILSFGGSKLLTAGRGGVVVTARADIHQRMRAYQHRGNLVCPLSELQAAVLLPQLNQLDARRAQRLANVRRLLAACADIAALRPFVVDLPDTEPDYYKVGFHYDASLAGLSRPRFVAALRAEGIAFDEGFPAFHVGRSAARFRTVGPLPEATRAHHQTVILHHPVLLGSADDIDQVERALRKVLHYAQDLEKLS